MHSGVMTFLWVVIVILFVIFLIVCGLVLPLLDVIEQFRHRRSPREVQGTGSPFSWLYPAGVSAETGGGVTDHSGRHAPQQPPRPPP
jgi:hypothetical protein